MIEDHLRQVRDYYYKSPKGIRDTIGRAYGVLPIHFRLGKAYRQFEKLILDGNSWTKQQFDDYQFCKLKNTLEHAYHSIPFYRDFYDQHGVTPAALKDFDDLTKFPTISKEVIKANFRKMLNPSFPEWKRLVTTTGGSTAEPMRFFQLKGYTRAKEKAFIGAGWKRVGYQYGDKAVQIKGRSVGEHHKNIFWEYEPIQNILEMDSNFICDQYIPDYLEAIDKFGADFLIGFPSSLYLIAKYIKDKNYSAPRFKAIMLASENVYAWQRTLLENVFGCRVYSHYGHSEMVLLGMEAENTNDLLFFPQYGYLEIVDKNNRPLRSAGEKGELVGTSFHNPVMPFIRYKTQDIGVIGEADPQQPHYPVLSDVEGRLQEFIVTRDKRLISVTTMGAAHFDTLDRVAATQYYQDVAGEVEFRVVPKEGFDSKDEKKIYKAVQEKLGPQVKLSIKAVESIEKTKSGKHLMLIQKIENVPLYEKDLLQDLG